MEHKFDDRTHAEVFSADGDNYYPDLTGGCGPIAISIAFQMPLRRTVRICRRLGRRVKSGDGTPNEALQGWIERQPRITKVGYWLLEGTYKARTIKDTGSVGTFIVLMEDHVTVVVNNVLIDSVDRRSERVIGLYEVRPPEALSL